MFMHLVNSESKLLSCVTTWLKLSVIDKQNKQKRSYLHLIRPSSSTQRVTENKEGHPYSSHPRGPSLHLITDVKTDLKRQYPFSLATVLVCQSRLMCTNGYEPLNNST